MNDYNPLILSGEFGGYWDSEEDYVPGPNDFNGEDDFEDEDDEE